MSNSYLDHDWIYNPDLKSQYLTSVADDARNIVRRIFIYSGLLESMYKKDLFEFNLKEVTEILKSLGASTFSSVQNSVYHIKKYIDWGIQYRSNNINPLDIVDSKWMQMFVDITKKLLFTRDEIYHGIIEGCVNQQDAVIFAGLFEGIKGKEMWELRNIKMSHVELELKSIRLFGADGSERVLENASDELLEILKRANTETHYYKKNGHVSPSARTSASVQLHENGHVIKPADMKKYEGTDPVSFHNINGRLTSIQKFFNIDNLTPTNVMRSGMLYMAKQIRDRDGHFSSREQIDEICKQYNVSIVDNHGYPMYNWAIYKHFINAEKIEELYGPAAGK